MTVMYLLIVLYLNFFISNIQENNATKILQKSEEQIQGIKSSYTEMIISVVCSIDRENDKITSVYDDAKLDGDRFYK